MKLQNIHNVREAISQEYIMRIYQNKTKVTIRMKCIRESIKDYGGFRSNIDRSMFKIDIH